MKISLIAAALVGCIATGATAAEAIVNGGFEAGTISPWFNDNDFSSSGTPWSATTTDAHSGSWSATNVGNIEIRQNFTGIATDDVTGASFWLKHPDQGGLPAYVTFFYSDFTNTGFIVSTSGIGWELFDVTANLVGGKTLTGFSVYGYNAGGADLTFLDDVSISFGGTVPEPATWTLMIGGFAMTGAAMRRRKSVAA